MWRALLVSLGVVAGGCLAAPAAERGTPLYTASTTPVPTTRVATLDFRLPTEGWKGKVLIKAVDGRDVSTLPAPFELLPGCHVVETATIPALTHGTESTAAIGPSVFTLQMRPGHEYTVIEAAEAPAGMIENAVFRTIERDPVSGLTVEILPATPADLEICRASFPSL